VDGRDKNEGANVSCAFCREWPRELAWAASAVWLDDGPARTLVHALKYGGWRIAAPPMAERMRLFGGERLHGLDALVPVPLGRTRLRERGHNQAALLAHALGRALGVPVLEDALRRVRETRTQTRLTPAERRRNVLGAFAAGGPGAAGLSVAVIDDVLTTGATLGAAAAALAEQGPASIGALTFARALVPA
jgi:predicted amidophosphoribosyltransferase